MAKRYKVLWGGAVGHSQGVVADEADFAPHDVNRLLDLGAIELFAGPVDADNRPATHHPGDLTDGDGNAVLPDGTNIGIDTPGSGSGSPDNGAALRARLEALTVEEIKAEAEMAGITIPSNVTKKAEIIHYLVQQAQE